MIKYREVPETNIIEVSIDGKIDADDYHQIAEKSLAFITRKGTVRVLKEIKSFDGFDLEIFKEKLLGDLIRHQGDISHTAIVSDQKWIEGLSNVFSAATACRTRFFPLAEIEAAREWLTTAKEESIEVTSDSKDNLMCFKVIDKLTHKDYENILIPTLEQVIKEYGKARMLVDFGSEYHGIEVTAMWDDTKFGIKHRTDFEKIGIVGGPSWSVWAAKISEKMMPCEVQSFKDSEYSKALEWVKEPLAAKV